MLSKLVSYNAHAQIMNHPLQIKLNVCFKKRKRVPVNSPFELANQPQTYRVLEMKRRGKVKKTNLKKIDLKGSRENLPFPLCPSFSLE